MRLKHPFYKFPFRFDVERLSAEVLAIPEEKWCRHPNDLKGNSFLPLVATGGNRFDDFDPPMRPTENLERLPYTQQILGEFRTLVGRARLMRLEPGHGVPPHFDSQQYWRDHTRVHVPVITDPAIRFHCEDISVHMAAGEAWTFDNWRTHQVVNETTTRRIHLTMDTFGSNEFWDLAKPLGDESKSPMFIPFSKLSRKPLLYETYAGAPVMSPARLDLEILNLLSDADAFSSNDRATLEYLRESLTTLRNEWRIAWHLKGPTEEGIPHFMSLAKWGASHASALSPSIKMASNGNSLLSALTETIHSLVHEDTVAKARIAKKVTAADIQFDRPVFIVAAPRSGSTMLFELMAANEAFVSLKDEGHEEVESIGALTPQAHDFDSNRLVEADARQTIVQQLRSNYLAGMKSADGVPLAALGTRMPGKVRFIEKTPKNALRIPFLKAAFPDAKFIFLHRAPQPNISAIMEAWQSGRLVTYPFLPGWNGPRWSMLLIPGWRNLNGKPLAEIAMHQWRDANEIILNDLEALAPDDWCSVRYEDIVENPVETLKRLCIFSDVPFGGRAFEAAQRSSTPSRSTISAPDANKWRKNENAIAPYLASLEQTAGRLAALRPAADTVV